MLDPTLSPDNLHAIACDSSLLTDERVEEISAHPSAWPALMSWASYVRTFPREQRGEIPVPALPLAEDGDEHAVITESSTLQRKWIYPILILVLAMLASAAAYFVFGTPEPSAADQTPAPIPTVTITAEPAPEPVQLIASGDGFSCRSVGETITCHGQNNYGQLGTGLANDQHVNVFNVDSAVTSLVAGANFACAQTQASVTCWGDNRWKQAGDADTLILPPTQIPSLSGKTVTSLTAGAIHACALADGHVLCWGSDYSGQLGSGKQGSQAAGVTEVKLSLTAQILLSSGFTTCAVSGEQTICWGANDEGRINNSDETILPPTLLEQITS